MCDHKFELLDIEKQKKSLRFTNIFSRTTRLFCSKCGEKKEYTEKIEVNIYEDRPSWTYNIK